MNAIANSREAEAQYAAALRSVFRLAAPFIAFSLLYACAPGPLPNRDANASRITYRVESLFPTLWAAYDAAPQTDDLGRINFAVNRVASTFPHLFEANVIGLGRRSPDERTLRDRLSFYVPIVAKNRKQIRNLSDQFRLALARYDATFRERFPDFSWTGTIFVTLSLGAFDGGLRRVAGQLALLFGIDKIVELYGADADLGPLFHHELFHVFHGQHDPQRERSEARAILKSLWGEGLAVYVSKLLNPTSSNRAALLGDDLVRRGKLMLRTLAAELRSKLSSKSPDDYRDFFLGSSPRKDIPPRSGYFVGLLVAERIAESMSLHDMVRLRGNRLYEAIDRALRELEAK